MRSPPDPPPPASGPNSVDHSEVHGLMPPAPPPPAPAAPPGPSVPFDPPAAPRAEPMDDAPPPAPTQRGTDVPAVTISVRSKAYPPPPPLPPDPPLAPFPPFPPPPQASPWALAVHPAGMLTYPIIEPMT